jgi:hypothetical protein
MRDHDKAKTVKTLRDFVEHPPPSSWKDEAHACVVDIMQDLYSFPSSLANSGHRSCDVRRVVQGCVDHVGGKCDPACQVAILLADDHTRSPEPRQMLGAKRKDDQPFAPADGDKHYWKTLAESCNHLDSLLSAGTATEQELKAAWERVRGARVPDVKQLGAFIRTQPAVKHVLLTKVMQQLTQHPYKDGCPERAVNGSDL